MTDTHLELLQALAAGHITEAELNSRLGAGCTLEKTCEQDWKRPGSDEKIHRNGHRISGCKNLNQDTDWLWTDWMDGECDRIP
jgi:hypothetical protein